MRKQGWILAGFFFHHLHHVLAALTNITVDDTSGDPTTGAQVAYFPAGVWNVGQDCVGCTAHPDPSQMYMGTWHDATFVPATGDDPNSTVVSLSVPFNGSAVYVYCVLTFTYDHPAGNSDMQFWIDNDIVGEFELPGNGSMNYDYNFPVYVNESIEAGPHTFRLETGHNNTKSLVLFDYLVYSYDDGTRNSSSSFQSSSQRSHRLGQTRHNLSKKLTTIIAVVVSLVVVLLIAAAIILFILFRRWRRTNALKSATDPTTTVVPREGPGDRWLANHAKEKPLPPLHTDDGPPQSIAYSDQQLYWLTRDPYPTALLSSASLVSSATSTHSSPFAFHPPPRSTSVLSRPLPTPVAMPSSPTNAPSVYLSSVSPFLSAGGHLTRTSTRATHGTIASSIAPYSDPHPPEEDIVFESDLSRHGAGPASIMTERSERSIPPSYHDSWGQNKEASRRLSF
ncbi:hypothetical protein NEOLEDRAFT_1179793 [Neolentinus lepideus HHB14362 ss-1]|uniref:Uncharacterized protein n=1 Tax=Neolentinus lepideus HHB14362 ss-1 TaxID=1314782 RepID=A0A165RH45_9AGAM|nr:hypothetical protein NEOLEDRAFT_1179793 [Neolentinus lepideus HHB14362 ss-1]